MYCLRDPIKLFFVCKKFEAWSLMNFSKQTLMNSPYLGQVIVTQTHPCPTPQPLIPDKKLPIPSLLLWTFFFQRCFYHAYTSKNGGRVFLPLTFMWMESSSIFSFLSSSFVQCLWDSFMRLHIAIIHFLL